MKSLYTSTLAGLALLGITGCATQQTFTQARLQGSVHSKTAAILTKKATQLPQTFTNGSFHSYGTTPYTNAAAYASIPAWAGKVYLFDEAGTNTLEERLDTTRHLNLRSDGNLPLAVLSDVENALPRTTASRELTFGAAGGKEYFFPKASEFELNNETAGNLSRVTVYGTGTTNAGVFVGIRELDYLDAKTQQKRQYEVLIVPNQPSVSVVKRKLDVAYGQEAGAHAAVGGGFAGVPGAAASVAIDTGLWFGAYLEGRNQIALGTQLSQTRNTLHGGLEQGIANVYAVVANAARDNVENILITPPHTNGYQMVINANVRSATYNPTNGAVGYVTDASGAYKIVEFARVAAIGGAAYLLHDHAARNDKNRRSGPRYGGGHTGNGNGLVPPANQHIDAPQVIIPGGNGIR